MPKVNRSFFFKGGNFLKAADVRTGEKYTIQSFQSATTRIGVRPILRLKETEKPFGLNATNFDKMIDNYGENSDAWIGKKISFAKVRVNNPQLNGKEVDGLRIV
jgi:hypothetical protein